jgi:hypothetical protein
VKNPIPEGFPIEFRSRKHFTEGARTLDEQLDVFRRFWMLPIPVSC